VKWFLNIVLFGAICLSASAQKSLSPAQAKLATEAHQILVTYCGKCHGKGGSYSDEMLLDYSKLVGGDEPFIVKEKVDKSFLYETIAEGDMPPKKAKNPVPADKLAILKNWIEVGAPDWNLAPKPKREFITNEEISIRVLEDLKKQPVRDRRFIRYYTLTHLYNAEESDDAMENYRLALAKLINSLSWEKEITKPIPIDAEKTILRIDLRDFDWDLSIWAKIIARYPYSPNFRYLSFFQVCELTLADVPFIRADWFIANAASPPLYHDILDLPKTDKELEDRLGVNVARNLRDAPGRRVWRSGFLESGVSKFNRIVERHKSPYGAYWKSYDFDSNKGRKNIFENPLDFEHAGGEIIFNLPNGLQAYLLVNSTGKRIDEAPVNIVFTTQGRDPVIRNGLTCMACHTSGMKEFKDRTGEIHLNILKTRYDDADTKDFALALYPEGKAINALVEKDKKTFEDAVEELGGVIGNKEPIELLTNLFQDSLSAKMAAAEVGLEEPAFLNQLENYELSGGKGLNPLASGGNIAREAWEEKVTDFVNKLELAKSRQQSLVVMKKLKALEVTSIGTGKKRKVIWFTGETLRKAEAEFFRIYPKFKMGEDSEEAIILKGNRKKHIVVSRGLGTALAHSIVDSVKLLSEWTSGISVDREYTVDEHKVEGDVRVEYIKNTTKSNIGPFQFQSVDILIEYTNDSVPGDWHHRSAMDSTCTVKGKTGSLLTRQTLINNFRANANDLNATAFSETLQEEGLSIGDFVGGLLKEGSDKYTFIICEGKLTQEFRTYLIVQAK
jgi:hypothetical protein